MNLKVRGKAPKGSMTISLDDPPMGVSMESVTVTEKDKRVTLSIDSDEEIVKVGDKGYLIVAGFAGNKNVLVGMAPAIPCEIVEQG
jgi:hypothetical protein